MQIGLGPILSYVESPYGANMKTSVNPVELASFIIVVVVIIVVIAIITN